MLNNNKLDRFISISQAAKQLKVSMEEVTNFVEEGDLIAAIMPDYSLGISEKSLNKLLPREELPDYQAFAHLIGQEISISEAGRQYKLNTSTLTRWMQRGYVTKIRKQGRLTLLNEADVAYCAAIYHQNEGQGKRVFNRNGKPIQRNPDNQ
ncbi:MAG: hypothetical protein JEZ06_11820 [Anaerolineaceae bacterium]|nr:hypothetical protein [Anaerolineaceae bacterium]